MNTLSGFTPAAVLETLFRRKFLVVLLPAMILGLGATIVLFAPRTYRSEAKLFLQVGRESVGIDPTAQTGGQMVSLQQQGRDSEISSAMDLIRSRGVLAEVVKRLGADLILGGVLPGDGEPTEPNVVAAALGATLGQAIKTLKSIDPVSKEEEALIELEESLGVDAERDSTMLSVTYSSKSPAGAQKILQEVLDVYQQAHLRVHRNSGSRAFFESQEALLRGQLDESLERLRKAKTEIGVASIDARRANLEGQLQSIQMASYGAEADRIAAAASLADAVRQLQGTPARLMTSMRKAPNEGADLMREQLYELQVKQADLKARYSDTHPLVRAISNQVDQAEKFVVEQAEVREETVDDINPIHRQLTMSVKEKETQLAGLEARLDMLAQQRDSIRQDLEKLNADEVQLSQLERDKSLMNRKYFQYAENLEQARIDEALEENRVSSISVAQAPTRTEKPASPSKLLVTLGSMVLAVAATGSAILGLEQIDDRLRGERNAEATTGVPVLASIPDNAVHGRVLS